MRAGQTPRGALATLLGLLPLLLATQGFAVVADDVCPPDADPCVLNAGTVVDVPVDSTLDFGSRALVMAPGSGTKIQVAPGVSLVIQAGSLTMGAGSGVLGPSSDITIDVQGDVVIAQDGNTRARIDVADAITPGDITILTGSGDVVVDGTLDARGKSTDASFGSIDLVVGRDVAITGEVRASGLGIAGGGEVTIAAGREINVSGSIDVSGSDGGIVDLSATARIVTSAGSATSRLDARASDGGGSGGEIDFTTPGNVVIGSTVHVQGEASRDFGGDGGFLAIDAGRTVTLAAPIRLFGTYPDGAGGEMDVEAGLDIVQTADIDAIGKPVYGLGGLVGLSAERNAFLGNIDASGDCDQCDGGEIDVEAWCALAVPPTATLKATGLGGAVSLQAGGSLTVGGTIAATDTVDIFVHPDAGDPNLTGATITPDPYVASDPGVIPCGGLPGLHCGDGVIDSGEECDDGNRQSCDGCSSICLLEAPGNGRVDCGEVCDDGNLTSCDGCAADLSREDNVCGDGIAECGEECDDGNVTACDGCSPTCRIERCGNGIPECGEECDLGDALNGTPNSCCSADCTFQVPATCGNGVVDSPCEVCDDGNRDDCDGCDHRCFVEACGNGTPECDEECDDFNLDPCDGCSPTCHIEQCGNGIVECGEECDEGAQNGQPGSTCLADVCQPGSLCSSQSTGPCIPCSGDRDCDPRGRCGGVACVDGVCQMSPLDCDDGNPCTLDTCDPDAGCMHELRDAAEVPECTPSDLCTVATCDAQLGCVETVLSGFPGVECSVDAVDAELLAPDVDPRALRKLQRLTDKIRAKVAIAEDGNATGKGRKIKKGLAKSGRLLGKLRKKVEHFTGPQIPLGVASRIVAAIDAAAERIQALRTYLQV
jgi:cysteine-rich repeat protein